MPTEEQGGRGPDLTQEDLLGYFIFLLIQVVIRFMVEVKMERSVGLRDI